MGLCTFQFTKFQLVLSPYTDAVNTSLLLVVSFDIPVVCSRKETLENKNSTVKFTPQLKSIVTDQISDMEDKLSMWLCMFDGIYELFSCKGFLNLSETRSAGLVGTTCRKL